MFKFYFLSFLLFCLFSKPIQAEKIVIKAAVAEEFECGLHAKYLRYFAEKLNVDIKIFTMPFARRLMQVKKGELDLIVGIQRTSDREKDLIYITPHYEIQSHNIFTLKEGGNTKSKFRRDLSNKLMGISRHSNYFKEFDVDNTIQKVETRGLQHSIELLLKKRIDYFLHFDKSTLILLKKLNAHDKVIKTTYQPNLNIEHYLAISKHSHLTKRIEELEKIMKEAIKKNELEKIRLAHYNKNI